jgi:glycogen phosphorylase
MPELSESNETQVLTSSDITSLYEPGKPADTLMKVVALIASRFNTEVCSAYLLEPDRSNLVLAATLGLHPRCIGKLRMSLSQGLTGLVAEQVMPVAVRDAPNHPRFKLVPDLEEAGIHSFLGVPIIDRGVLQGVLIVQTKEPRTRGSGQRGRARHQRSAHL